MNPTPTNPQGGATTGLALDACSACWQPIETAPRTGKTLLIYDPTREKSVRLARYGYEPDGDSLEYVWHDGYQTFRPTHWLLLPPLPNVKDEPRPQHGPEHH